MNTTDVERVKQANEREMQRYRASRLCRLLYDDATTEQTKKAVLAGLQPWSDAFQRMIDARAQAETDPDLKTLAVEHRAEEVGHNDILARSRGGREVVVWDPVIEAGAAWFVDQFRTLPSVSRAVLAHLALEAGSLVFSQAGVHAFPNDDYFELHDEADVEHLEMGFQVLRSRSDWSADDLVALLDRAWQIITMVSDRIAELAVRDTVAA